VRGRRGGVLVLALASAACYHAVVTTGRPPGDRVIARRSASAFLFGLVPPEVIDAGIDCPGGVATVETRHSFVNAVIGIATIGVYTPMTIVVTCAGTGAGAVPGPARSAARPPSGAVVSPDGPGSGRP
jgi:hypothetical protein